MNEFSLVTFVLWQKQTAEIKEKQSSVMDELSKVEPAVQDAKMGEFDEQPMMEKIEMSWNGGRILGWCLL